MINHYDANILTSDRHETEIKNILREVVLYLRTSQMDLASIFLFLSNFMTIRKLLNLRIKLVFVGVCVYVCNIKEESKFTSLIWIFNCSSPTYWEDHPSEIYKSGTLATNQVTKWLGLFLEILFYSTGLFTYPCANTTILITVALY